MTERSPIDAFKDVLSGTARSIARDAEVEVGFTADAPHVAGKAIKVPTPGRNLPADQVALARGFADANALKLRYHNAKIHGSSAPGEAVARACSMRSSRHGSRRSGRGRWRGCVPTSTMRSTCG